MCFHEVSMSKQVKSVYRNLNEHCHRADLRFSNLSDSLNSPKVFSTEEIFSHVFLSISYWIHFIRVIR